MRRPDWWLDALHALERPGRSRLGYAADEFTRRTDTKMDTGAAIAIVVSVALALGGYLFTFVHDRRKAQHTARLERLDRQIRELYGPMYALAESSSRTWAAFRQRYRPGHVAYFGDIEEPTDDELMAWRLWMTEVFQPNNERMIELLFKHAELLEEDEIPEPLLDLVAHVLSHKAVLARWANGDIAEHTPLLNYPLEVNAWAADGYRKLKADQREMLRITG